MPLRTEPTSQSLEKKLLIAGFEVPEILVIFLLLSILNFLFGQTNYKLLLVWIPIAALAIALRIGKRGKPDGYLVHLVRYYRRPKYLSAFQDPTESKPVPKVNQSQ